MNISGKMKKVNQKALPARALIIIPADVVDLAVAEAGQETTAVDAADLEDRPFCHSRPARCGGIQKDNITQLHKKHPFANWRIKGCFLFI